MKTTGRRSLILIILTVAFFFGLSVFLYGLVTHGGAWAIQPFNGHLTGASTSSAGRVLDRNGTVLAQTKNGKRVYTDDLETRRAMLHAVGDSNGFISTGVQSVYCGELFGYNPITGLASPTGKSAGCDINLTLDASLCRLAREKLGDRNGVAAVYNYKTGEMLCMVSTPDFDPQNPPKDLDTNKAYSGAYLNKVLSSTFIPGSIFKTVTSAAAIENISDLDSRVWNCPGSITVNGNQITDIRSYGKLHFKDALAKSSNVAFAQIAIELGTERMSAEAQSMGFGHNFSLDGISCAKSSYSVKGASEDELGWSGVGQYTDLVNPFHFLVLMGAVANGGTPVMPYMVKSIVQPLGLPQKTGSGQMGSELLQPSTAERLKSYLRYNVTNQYGDSMFSNLAVCAKTGTGEVGGGKSPNCWMVGFSSNSSTPLAFVVLVENSSSGSLSSAGRIASSLMTAAAKVVS